MPERRFQSLASREEEPALAAVPGALTSSRPGTVLLHPGVYDVLQAGLAVGKILVGQTATGLRETWVLYDTFVAPSATTRMSSFQLRHQSTTPIVPPSSTHRAFRLTMTCWLEQSSHTFAACRVASWQPLCSDVQTVALQVSIPRQLGSGPVFVIRQISPGGATDLGHVHVPTPVAQSTTSPTLFDNIARTELWLMAVAPSPLPIGDNLEIAYLPNESLQAIYGGYQRGIGSHAAIWSYAYDRLISQSGN